MRKSILLLGVSFFMLTACRQSDLPPAPGNGGSGGNPTPAPVASATPRTGPSAQPSVAPSPMTSPSPTATPVAFGGFKKVFIILLENEDDTDALKQPFMASLAKQGAYLSNFTAVTHPSQPNYVAMTSGATQGVTGDGTYNLNVRSLANLLDEKGKSWKSYAENYPGNCFLKDSGKYKRKHEPFISYKYVQSNPSVCAKIVNSTELAKDIEQGTLPDYSFYVPNMDNDGHDTDVAFADTWLKNAFGSLLKDPRFMKDMLFIVTFDENSGTSGNKIYMTLYGDSVIPGAVLTEHQDFYALLRTIEMGLGLGDLGQNDARAKPITGIWK